MAWKNLTEDIAELFDTSLDDDLQLEEALSLRAALLRRIRNEKKHERLLREWLQEPLILCAMCPKYFRRPFKRGGIVCCSAECKRRHRLQLIKLARLTTEERKKKYRIQEYNKRKYRKCLECNKLFVVPYKGGTPSSYCKDTCRIERRKRLVREYSRQQRLKVKERKKNGQTS